jgi:DNA-binding MarR family transcriptional regulator
MRAEEDFGWHLGVLLRAYHCEVAAVLADLPHVTRGYQVLAEVVHGDQPTQLALAAHLGVDRTVMTYVIDDMAAAGLVERRQSPVDRRARKVVGTAQGEQVLALLERGVRAAEERVLGTLDPAEREAFRALLRRVACAVHETGAAVDACQVAQDVLGGAAVAG